MFKPIINWLKGFFLFRLLPFGAIVLVIFIIMAIADSSQEQTTICVAYTTEQLRERFEQVGLDTASISNDLLTLTLESQNLALHITNNITGFTWSHSSSYEDMNPVWQDFAASGVTINTHFNNQFGRQFSFTDKAILSYANDNTIIADVFFEEAGIALQIEYRLENDNISIIVLFESIIEANRDFELQTINLHPFLGASRGEQDGFIFVPSGPGAIIDLNYITRARQPFSGTVFGDDIGFHGNSINMRTSQLRPPNNITLPVYGIGYNNNALMSVITSGYEHSTIDAYSSGIITPYNWVGATFRYRGLHTMAFLSTGSQMNQVVPNQIDIRLELFVLSEESANYHGMARRLQVFFADNNIIKPLTAPHGDIFANIFAADNESVLIGRRTITMSSPEQILEMANNLFDIAQNGLRMEVIGYKRGGFTNQSPYLTSLIGSDSDWRRLNNSFNDNNYIFFHRDYMRAFTSSIRRWHIAQNISEELMSMHNDNRIHMGAFIDYSVLSFLNPHISQRIFERDRFDRFDIQGISFDSMGQILNSIHGRHKHTRGEMIQFYRDMLETRDLNYAFHRPNIYMWDKSQIMFDMPITSSDFTIISHSVPFVPILLSGHSELFAVYANFQPSHIDYLLKLVEFNMRPSYMLTWECPTLLFNTESNWINSSQWEIWQSQIIRDIEFLQDAWQGDALFIEHRQVSTGIYESVFDNGNTIIVNYTNTPFITDDGVLVESRNYIVR